MIYTKSDYAYLKIKEDILNGSLAPGKKLIINELASAYNFSPMPIRSALARLEQDGLIQSVPHMGSTVSITTFNDYFSLMLLRMDVEALATMFTTMAPPPGLIDTLESLLADMLEFNSTHNYKKYRTANRAFHVEIYTACNNPIVIQQYNHLVDRTKLSVNTFEALPQSTQESCNEHSLWLDAIKAGDVKKSVSIIRSHRCRACIATLTLAKESLVTGNSASVFSAPFLQNTTMENIASYMQIFESIREQNCIQ